MAKTDFRSRPPSKRAAERFSKNRIKNRPSSAWAYPSVSIRDPRVYPILLLQEACSSLGSRLFMRIREELALAYYVGAYEQSGTLPGYFCFYAGTELAQARRVVEEIFSEAGKLCQDGLSPEELDRTKAKLLGQRAIGQQDIGAVARTAAVHELLGLGYDFAQKEDELIRNVTLGEVQDAARLILNPDNCVVSIVGPEEV
jgi:zinc protease